MTLSLLTQPGFPQFAEQLAPQSGLATWSSLWVRTQGGLLILAAEWSAVAATNGTITLDGGIGPLGAGTLTPDIIIQNIPLPSGVYGTGPVVGAVAGNIAIVIRNPMPFHRLTYTRVAGGAVDQFNVYQYQRPD
jgi:hypothetical protein